MWSVLLQPIEGIHHSSSSAIRCLNQGKMLANDSCYSFIIPFSPFEILWIVYQVSWMGVFSSKQEFNLLSKEGNERGCVTHKGRDVPVKFIYEYRKCGSGLSSSSVAQWSIGCEKSEIGSATLYLRLWVFWTQNVCCVHHIKTLFFHHCLTYIKSLILHVLIELNRFQRHDIHFWYMCGSGCCLLLNMLCVCHIQAQVAFLQGERKGQENMKQDLVRRIKMLEYALKQERWDKALCPCLLVSLYHLRFSCICCAYVVVFCVVIGLSTRSWRQEMTRVLETRNQRLRQTFVCSAEPCSPCYLQIFY